MIELKQKYYIAKPKVITEDFLVTHADNIKIDEEQKIITCDLGTYENDVFIADNSAISRTFSYEDSEDLTKVVKNNDLVLFEIDKSKIWK